MHNELGHQPQNNNTKEQNQPPTVQKQQQPQQQKQTHSICEFYVARKNRQCKFQVAKGSRFCTAHSQDHQNKIECPYEKGMFIDQAKFQRHLEICPKLRDKKKQESSQWFNKGVNLNQEKIEVKPANIEAVVDLEEGKLREIIKRVVKFYLISFNPKAKHYIWSTQQQKIENLTNDHCQGHLLAEAAYKAGLIRDDIIYIQFGAGKGILSYHLAERVKKQLNKMSKNVLLQRETRRNKFDRFMKANPYFQRYKSDVSDFDVNRLPETMAQTALLKSPNLDPKKEAAQLNQLQIVGVCKHMCGGALDISVRALMKTKMSGCILASCCHHLCSYDSYLNNKFFENQGFTPDDIQIIFRISAWGTKLSTVKEQDIDFEKMLNLQSGDLSAEIKVVVGRICKRLIDLGRARVLKCGLRRYCSDQITPQNFVLITQQ